MLVVLVGVGKTGRSGDVGRAELGPALGCELGRGEVAQGAVRAERVVLAAEAGEGDLGATEGVEELAVEELVAELVVEALDVGVLPRGAGADVERADRLRLQPIPDGVGDELWAVVAAQVTRRPAPGHDLSDDRDHVLGAQAPGRVQGEALAGVLVHHREDPEAGPGAGLVVHEVAAPDMVGVRDPLALRRRQAQPAGLALALADLQAALGPDALHPLRVHARPGTAQQRRDPPVAVARMPLAELHHPLFQFLAWPAPAEAKHGVRPHLLSCAPKGGQKSRI